MGYRVVGKGCFLFDRPTVDKDPLYKIKFSGSGSAQVTKILIVKRGPMGALLTEHATNGEWTRSSS